MAGENIFIVEDEEDIFELVRYNLVKEGYNVEGVSSGEDALEVIKSYLPDLILLDLMLPGVDGLQVCRQVKDDPRTAGIPIIMLTAKGEDKDIVTGLECGADDYITKPFSISVLSARIKTSLRREEKKQPTKRSVLKVKDLMIDFDRHEVFLNNKQADLTPTEFKVLAFLASKPESVFSRYQIIDAIRDEEYAVTDRSVDVLIVGLRKKLDSCSSYIETVRGVGYRFKG